MTERENMLDRYFSKFNDAFLQALPNKLTLARVAAIPLLMVAYPLDYFFLDIVCAIIFSVAAITDFLDGYLARKYNAVSDFGALIDPVADKMLVGAALILLSSRGVLPSFMAILLVSREFAVSGIRLVSLRDGFNIPVDTLGKYKTVLQDIGIVMLFVNRPLFDMSLYVVGMLLLWAALALSIYSAYFYWNSYWKTKNQPKQQEEDLEATSPSSLD